jgi:hypothetical protein
MLNMSFKNLAINKILVVAIGLTTNSVLANGEIGDHVNDLQAHLTVYEEEVNWLIARVAEMVTTYDDQGIEAAQTDDLMEFWEAVDFHAAIELNYIQIYASIWQGLYGVKSSIDSGTEISSVMQEKGNLEKALWQALGAVKLAARYQQEGLIDSDSITESIILSPTETIDEIKLSLDRSTAKFAERLPEEAVDIVLNTYLQLFEGLEGDLIARDADLVEDLEKDFNVTLPQALQSNSSLQDIRSVVDVMKTKLDQSKSILGTIESNRRDVF